MPRILLYYLVFALAPLGVNAADKSRGEVEFPVQAAFLPQDDDPVDNAVTCRIGEECQILDETQHTIGLSLNVWESRSHCLMQRISLDCRLDRCSFENGRLQLDFAGERRFDVFEGSGSGVETLLVLRTRREIGRVLLILPDLGPACLGAGAQ